MPFNLTKDEQADITRLVVELTSATNKINSTVIDYNESLQSLRTPVEEAVTDYNRILAEVRALRDDIVNKAQEKISEKSEGWQESDTGQSAQAWAEEWENIDLDDIDYQWPDELEIDVGDIASDLEQLPADADG